MRKLLREHQKVRYNIGASWSHHLSIKVTVQPASPFTTAIYDVQETTCDKQCRLKKQKYFCNTESRVPRATPSPNRHGSPQTKKSKGDRKHGREDPAAFLVLLPSLRAAENPASAPHLQEGVDLHVGGR